MRIENQWGAVRRVYLRQSSINSFMQCPEKARHEYFVLDPDVQRYTDASATGQALHLGMEELLRGNVTNWQEMSAYCRHALQHIARTDGIRYVQADLEKCLTYYKGWAQAAFESDAIADMVNHPSLKIEESFRLLVERRGDIELWFEGKMDAVTYDVVDWKTAARKYNEYEKQAWSIQPTMYCWASQQLGLTSGDEFRYFVFPKVMKKPEIQIIPIHRTQGMRDFLVEQGFRIAKFMLDTGTDKHWPLNDQHWLCSQKWCLNWNDCKGSFLSHGKE